MSESNTPRSVIDAAVVLVCEPAWRHRRGVRECASNDLDNVLRAGAARDRLGNEFQPRHVTRVRLPDVDVASQFHAVNHPTPAAS